jgi:hypothetical protein
MSSSSCTDCTAPNTVWMYGASNGNFLALSTANAYSHLCVRTAAIPSY